MKVFNYSEARQNFSMLLNTALKEDVVIRRKDGSRFKLVPITDPKPKSPFDVDGIDTNVSTDEILETIREMRSGDTDK